jgi:DNA-binding FadR family transcriptional regulator
MTSSGFAPITRTSVTDTVFAELRDAILTGRFAPGDSLPPERELAASFAVNRHAVREALGRLATAGFVNVVHGGGTVVLDVRSTAGLDLLAHVARSADEPDPKLIRDGLEMRRCIGIEAVRLAATRGTPGAHARIEASTTAYGDHSHPVADRAFWREVVDASGNIAFRLALNSLLHAIDARPEAMDVLLADDRADTIPHAPLAKAITARDADLAAELADRILTQALDAWTHQQTQQPQQGAAGVQPA